MNKKEVLRAIEDAANNKNIVITGTSSGIGLESLKILAGCGANIFVGVRNTEKMNQIVESLSTTSKAKIHVLPIDLTDANSIFDFAGSLKTLCPDGIDLLINNAGIFAREKQILDCGIEVHFFTNCIAPIILSQCLLELLSKKQNSKIVFVSSVSILHAKIDPNDFDKQSENNAIKLYANTKRCLTCFATKWKAELSVRNQGSNGTKCGVDIDIIHPGISGTSLLHYSHSKLSKFGYKFVRFGMKLIFPSPQKVCLCELAPLFLKTQVGEWICPGGAFSVYGNPKVKKIKFKAESDKTEEFCYKKIQEIVDDLTKNITKN